MISIEWSAVSSGERVSIQFPHVVRCLMIASNNDGEQWRGFLARIVPVPMLKCSGRYQRRRTHEIAPIFDTLGVLPCKVSRIGFSQPGNRHI